LVKSLTHDFGIQTSSVNEAHNIQPRPLPSGNYFRIS